MALPVPFQANVRLTRRLALAAVVILVVVAPASAQPPTVEQMLKFEPVQKGVDISTPANAEWAQCEIKLETGKVPKSGGWVLLDSKKQIVRKFFDSNGDQKVDVWSYYKDGAEVYREIDTNFNDRADQYRWLNSGGSKWGIDANEDGKIDIWRVISAEEAAQEAYQAAVTRDFARLKALFLTEEEIRALNLSAAHAARIREQQGKAQAKFNELCTKVTTLNAKAQFERVESAIPQCVPANAATGPAQDIFCFSSRTVYYKGTDNKDEWLNTGEVILAGQAWRLTDAPSVGDIVISPGGGGGGIVAGIDPALKKLLEDLNAMGEQPMSPGGAGPHKAVVDYTVKRVTLLEQIYAKVAEPKEKEMWLRQILDNLCSGHQANKGDNSLLTRLGQYKAQLVQSVPNSNIAGYAHYREMWARFAIALIEGDAVKVQREWNEELAKFVAAYPKAEDAPDALLQLAMSSEYAGKDKQEEAKKYYGLIAANFPEHPLAPKAKGAVRRLDLNGKPMQLAAPTLQGSPFDLARLNGKVVVVYYWASNCKVCVGDFAVMKQMHAALNSKGMEIVSVNLDETQAAAMAHLASNPLPGTHLFMATEQAKGLESPLATQYGIVGLPTIILIGKDGRVIDRSIQINELEDAVKKAL